MRAVELRILLILFFFITSIVCLNLKKASEDCLNGSSLPRNQEISCLTLNGVKINKIERQNQTFYCIYYEKKTGNRNEFDVLSFDLHEDYDLKYVSKKKVMEIKKHSNDKKISLLRPVQTLSQTMQ